MTNDEIAKELATWSPDGRADLTAVVYYVARAVYERGMAEFSFTWTDRDGRSSCQAKIQAADYDEAVAKLGSAGKATWLPSS